MATSEDSRWPPPRTTTWPLTPDGAVELVQLDVDTESSW